MAAKCPLCGSTVIYEGFNKTVCLGAECQNEASPEERMDWELDNMLGVVGGTDPYPDDEKTPVLYNWYGPAFVDTKK